jgi:hypothetical protein
MSAYLDKIIKGMTPKQREAVLATADAADRRVPNFVHDRTIDALYRKRLIREVNNLKGGFNWSVLTYNGKRIAAALAERNARAAGIPAFDHAEAVAIVTGTPTPEPAPEPAPETAGTMLRAALAIHGIRPVTDECSYAMAVDPKTPRAEVLNVFHLVVADRAPSTDHAPEEHTGWVVDCYDGNGQPGGNSRPLWESGDGTARVDCLTDSAAAAAVIAYYLPHGQPGAILGFALATRGIPFHLEADPTWGQLLVVDLDRIGGTGTLEIADRSHSLFHPVSEHTGWSIFRKDANGEFVPPTCTPVFISGDGATAVDLFEDTENVIEYVENVAFRQ